MPIRNIPRYMSDICSVAVEELFEERQKQKPNPILFSIHGKAKDTKVFCDWLASITSCDCTDIDDCSAMTIYEAGAMILANPWLRRKIQEWPNITFRINATAIINNVCPV